MCKAQATQTFEFCAREAAQIFGGLSYTRGGQGEKIERLYREVRGKSNARFESPFVLLTNYYFSIRYPRWLRRLVSQLHLLILVLIATFSVEIMLDLGVRQSMKIATFMGAKM